MKDKIRKRVQEKRRTELNKESFERKPKKWQRRRERES